MAPSVVNTAAFVTGLFAASLPAAGPAWLGLTSAALVAAEC